MKLIEKDTFGDDINIAHLTDRINYQDLQESQDCLISVQYNELDCGNTAYGFNQPFLNNEANLYFQRRPSTTSLIKAFILGIFIGLE